MRSNRKKSVSSNSSDKEIDFLEEEFLKLTTIDIPIPKKEIDIYEPEVKEVMKSGCNRQIAEYALLKYKEIEDKDNYSEKLYKLREEYDIIKKDIIMNSRKDVEEYVQSGNVALDKKNNDEIKLDGFENEIEEILDSEVLYKMKKENKNLDNVEKYAKFYLYQNLIKEKDKKEFYEKRKKYYVKREAVIEAALRTIKKIVNNEEEYKKFYEDYFTDEKEQFIIYN